MTRKKLVKKNAGGGAGPVPIRRSYEREAVEQRSKYPDPREIRPRDRMNTEEVRRMKLSRSEQRLAELNREVALTQMEDDPNRMRLAQALNEKAERYMQAHGTDYTTAVRAVSQEEMKLSQEPSLQEVEAYAEKHDVDLGQAARAINAQHATAQDGGSVSIAPEVDIDQENAELEKALKERGHDV